MDRIPTNYARVTGLEYLDGEDLLHIEQQSRILTLDECFEFLMIDKSQVPEKELDIAERVWRRGRKKAVGMACEALFIQMTQRNGTNACAEYLSKFAGDFQVEGSASPAGTGGGMNFNVFMPGEKPDGD